MGRQRTAAVIAIVLLAPFFCARVDAQRSRVTAPSLDVLTRWVRAVNQHQPGYPDAPIQGAIGMTYGMRAALNTSLPLFVRVLRTNVEFKRDDLEERLTMLGRAVRKDPGPEAFLKRAAILHADAVVFADTFAPPPYEAPRVQSDSPLLDNQPVTLTRDGVVIGEDTRIWHLPFARSLLEMLPPGEKEFVGDWYHAVAAFLFSKGMLADATGHLKQAERVLPDDPRALFDRATYAETFGLAIFQVLDDSRIPGEGKTNGEAERLYRRAVDVDPSYVEARVRLARLLDHRGRHDEAAVEITHALDARPSGVTAFYAYIVAGRIASARAQHQEALRLYREALALYEQAQSARLGASHAALMLSDMTQTMAPIAGLGGKDDDPWLNYRLGAGRDVDTLLLALWTRASQ
jgi:hypothetical protein